jgi:hypothetical protein
MAREASRGRVTIGDELGADVRRRARESLRLAEQRLDAADLLARSPHRVESMRVLVRALQTLEGTIDQLKTAANGSLSAIVPEETHEALRTFRAQLESSPEADALLSREQLTKWREVRRFAAKLRVKLRRALLTRNQFIVRWVAVGAAVLGAVALLRLGITHLRDGVVATASTSYSSYFGPENTLDGNPNTEWLAPDDTAAWVEHDYRPAIDVRAVKVNNSRNDPYFDRATKDVTVELYRGNSLVAQASAAFEPTSLTELTSLEMAVVGQGITRVRYIARSYYGKGAGFADVDVIEGKP